MVCVWYLLSYFNFLLDLLSWLFWYLWDALPLGWLHLSRPSFPSLVFQPFVSSVGGILTLAFFTSSLPPPGPWWLCVKSLGHASCILNHSCIYLISASHLHYNAQYLRASSQISPQIPSLDNLVDCAEIALKTASPRNVSSESLFISWCKTPCLQTELFSLHLGCLFPLPCSCHLFTFFLSSVGLSSFPYNLLLPILGLQRYCCPWVSFQIVVRSCPGYSGDRDVCRLIPIWRQRTVIPWLRAAFIHWIFHPTSWGGLEVGCCYCTDTGSQR